MTMQATEGTSVTTQDMVTHRLSEEAYRALVSKLPKLHIDSQTSAIEAAAMVGREQVLAALRHGFVYAKG